MLLCQFIVSLAVVVYICSGKSLITFYTEEYSETSGWQANLDEYHQCYVVPFEIFYNVSNIKFENYEWFKWHFTLTVYSRAYCNGKYKQWQLDVSTYNFWQAGYVGSMNNEIQSWKISDEFLGDKEGTYTGRNENVLYPDFRVIESEE
ncbi:hypothetical protein BGX26_011032, partial [Mortierella sp. AD094]